MKNYKDLLVWQKAHAVALSVYNLSNAFPKHELYNLTSQIRRAALSAPTNISEGSGKYTQLDFARYLQNALGSTHEVEYLCFFAFELGYIDKSIHVKIDSEVNEVKAMLISLIQKVRGE